MKNFVIIALALTLGACGNTISGVGKDIQGTINDEPAEGDGLILTGNYSNKKTSGLSIAFLGNSTGGAGQVTDIFVS